MYAGPLRSSLKIRIRRGKSEQDILRREIAVSPLSQWRGASDSELEKIEDLREMRGLCPPEESADSLPSPNSPPGTDAENQRFSCAHSVRSPWTPKLRIGPGKIGPEIRGKELAIPLLS
jgi:hypothetical protein